MTAWDRFWHADGPAWPLGTFRLLFALVLAREVATSRVKNVFAIEGGGLHLPYVEGWPLLTESAYQWLHHLHYPLIVLLALGLATRWAAGGLLAMQGYLLFADQLNYRNHPYFFLLVLGVLAVSTCGDAVSLPAFRRGRGGGIPGPRTWQRLLQVQICLVYVFAGLQKLNPGYLSGRVLALHGERFAEHVAEWSRGEGVGAWTARLGDRGFMQVPSWIALALELGLPVALWVPRLRRPALVAGLLFHLAIAVTMQIDTFSAAMIAGYVLFLPAANPPVVPARREVS